MPRAGLMQMMRGTVSMRDMRSTPSNGLSHDHRQQDPHPPGGVVDDVVNGDDSKPSRSPGRRKFQRRRQTVDSSTPSIRTRMDGVAAGEVDDASPGRRGHQGQEPPPTLVGVISDLVTIPSYNPQQNQQAGQRPTKSTYDLIQNKRWDAIPAACVDRPSDARYTDGKNHLPIHWACYYGAPLDVVTALHEAHEGGVESINLKGDLPLHRACRGRASPEVVRFVRDANPDGASVENHYGETPVDLLDVSGRSYREREAVREVFYPRPAAAAAAATTHRFGGGGATVAMGYGGAPLRHSQHVDVPPPTVVPGVRSGSAVASSGTGRAGFDATSRPSGGGATAAAIGFGTVVGDVDAPPPHTVSPAAGPRPRLSAAEAAVVGPKNAPAPATIPEGPTYSSSTGEDEDTSNEVVSDGGGTSPAHPGGVSTHQPQLRRRRSADASSSSSGASGTGSRAPQAAATAPSPPVARSSSATAAETEATARQAARAGWIARRDDMGPLGGGGPPSAARSPSASSASAALEARAAAAQAEVAAREAERAAHVARRASARLDEAAAEARRARAEAEDARRRADEMRRAADEAEGRMLAEARRASAAEDERRLAEDGRSGAGAVAGASASASTSPPGAMPWDEEGGGSLRPGNASGAGTLRGGPVRAASFPGGGEEEGGQFHPTEDGGAIPLPPEPV